MASDDSLPRFNRSASYPVIKRFGRFGSLGSPSSFPSSPKSGENEAFLEKTARFLSSRAFLLTAACLYMLGCIALPHAPGFTSSKDQTGALNDEMSYVFQIDGKYNRFQAAGSYLLRRMNIESEKSSGNKYYHKLSVNNNPLVAYKKHGNVVPLLNALNYSFWAENEIENTSGYKFKLDEDLEPTNKDIPDGCPQGPVRIFIGITSRSGTESAVKKRAAIRDSWFQTVKEFSTSMQAYFMLSQQEDFSLQYTAELIAEEAFKYRDIVILPGLEKYVELPSKSFALLQYALSSPCKFTHIVKTDDDVFLRPQKLLDIVLNGELDYAMPFYYGGSVNTSAAKDGGHHLLMEWENNRIEKSTSKMSLVKAANYSVEDAEWSSLITFDGQSKKVSKPWMEKMYIGKVDSNKTSCFPGCEGVFPGWEPNRTSSSKWFLSHSVLSDDDAVDAFSVRWLSGWGYSKCTEDLTLQSKFSIFMVVLIKSIFYLLGISSMQCSAEI